MFGRVLFGAVDAVLALLEAGAGTYDRAKKLSRLLRKKKPAPDETPVPLTHRSVELQQQQIRQATAHRDAIPPPKP